MYTKLAEKLFIPGGQSVVSQAIAVEDYNRAQAEVTVYAGSLASVTIEAGNDLEN